MLKRTLDIIGVLILLIPLFLPLAVIAILVRVTSKGPAIYWSRRVGRHNKIFLMPKFRSMYVETPQVATHLLQNPETFITPFGKFLRKTSLDELPQLYSVLKGDMSFVGPRPALFNQDDLIDLRTKVGVDKLRPGITGWAQINGRDELPIPIKVDFDKYYLEHSSVLLDLKIVLSTAIKVFRKEGITH